MLLCPPPLCGYKSGLCLRLIIIGLANLFVRHGPPVEAISSLSAAVLLFVTY